MISINSHKVLDPRVWAHHFCLDQYTVWQISCRSSCGAHFFFSNANFWLALHIFNPIDGDIVGASSNLHLCAVDPSLTLRHFLVCKRNEYVFNCKWFTPTPSTRWLGSFLVVGQLACFTSHSGILLYPGEVAEVADAPLHCVQGRLHSKWELALIFVAAVSISIISFSLINFLLLNLK